MARPRSNYYQLLMFFLFNELSRTTMRPHCTHESHNQVESLTRDLRRPYEGSEARTWTTLSTLIGVCQQAGSYHNFYVWFVVPDVEILGQKTSSAWSRWFTVRRPTSQGRKQCSPEWPAPVWITTLMPTDLRRSTVMEPLPSGPRFQNKLHPLS